MEIGVSAKLRSWGFLLTLDGPLAIRNQVVIHRLLPLEVPLEAKVVEAIFGCIECHADDVRHDKQFRVRGLSNTEFDRGAACDRCPGRWGLHLDYPRSLVFGMPRLEVVDQDDMEVSFLCRLVNRLLGISDRL